MEQLNIVRCTAEGCKNGSIDGRGMYLPDRVTLYRAAGKWLLSDELAQFALCKHHVRVTGEATGWKVLFRPYTEEFTTRKCREEQVLAEEAAAAAWREQQRFAEGRNIASRLGVTVKTVSPIGLHGEQGKLISLSKASRKAHEHKREKRLDREDRRAEVVARNAQLRQLTSGELHEAAE